MQVNRLFQIIYILLDRKTITAKELSERLEVSIRTIYRDVDALSVAGIPIYTAKGKGGGIGLLDHFILNKSLLSEKDQKEILIGLQSLKATSYFDTEDTASKLSRLFKKDNVNWIEVDFSKWGDSKDKVKFDILKKAILDNKVISFKYVNSYGEKSLRKIEPLKLWFKNKDWYVQGFCLQKEEFRVFKISRIIDIDELSEHFHRELPKDIKIDEFKYDRKDSIDLKLLFNKNISHRVYDEFIRETIKEEKNGLVVTIKCPFGYWLYSYILSFGSYVEVLEPEFIRNEIILEIKKTLDLYK